MATSKNFHDRMMERLASVGEFSSRKMMGEYCVYHRGKMVAEMCDDRFLLKPSASVIAFMPDAQREYPYEGSKTLMLVTDLSQDISFLKELFTRMYDELPEPKKRKPVTAQNDTFRCSNSTRCRRMFLLLRIQTYILMS